MDNYVENALRIIEEKEASLKKDEEDRNSRSEACVKALFELVNKNINGIRETRITRTEHWSWVSFLLCGFTVNIEDLDGRLFISSYLYPKNENEEKIINCLLGECGRKRYVDTKYGHAFNHNFEKYFLYQKLLIDYTDSISMVEGIVQYLIGVSITTRNKVNE